MCCRTWWTCTWPRSGGSWDLTSSARAAARATSSMLSSLRARLLLWYTLILAVVIATFAATLGYLFWRSLVDDIDQGLQASSAALVEGLRPTPSGDFDLVIPREYRLPDANAAPATYYAVWNRDGELDRSIDERVRRALARWHRHRHA